MTVLKISKLQGFEKKKKTTVRKYDVLCGQSRRTASCKELELHNRYDISCKVRIFYKWHIIKVHKYKCHKPYSFFLDQDNHELVRRK